MWHEKMMKNERMKAMKACMKNVSWDLPCANEVECSVVEWVKRNTFEVVWSSREKE